MNIKYLLIFSQSKIWHCSQIPFSAGQHYAVPFCLCCKCRSIIAADQSQIWYHSCLTVHRQITWASGKFIQSNAWPIFTWLKENKFQKKSKKQVRTHLDSTAVIRRPRLVVLGTNDVNFSTLLHVEHAEIRTDIGPTVDEAMLCKNIVVSPFRLHFYPILDQHNWLTQSNQHVSHISIRLNNGKITNFHCDVFESSSNVFVAVDIHMDAAK